VWAGSTTSVPESASASEQWSTRGPALTVIPQPWAGRSAGQEEGPQPVRLTDRHSVCTATGALGDQTTHTWNVRPQAPTPAASTNESHWNVDWLGTLGHCSGVFDWDCGAPVSPSCRHLLRSDSDRSLSSGSMVLAPVPSSWATQSKVAPRETPKISAINGRFGAGAWRFARRASQADEPKRSLLTHGLNHWRHEGENHYHSRQLVSGSWVPLPWLGLCLPRRRRHRWFLWMACCAISRGHSCRATLG
jgi:hypothetical protein